MFMMLSTLFAAVENGWTEDKAIRQGVNIEWFRSASGTADGAFYVWSDTKAGGRDLWCQFVSSDPNAVMPDPILVDGKPNRQEDPVVIQSTDGNYIVAWVDFSSDPDGDVYAQKLDPNGNLLWQEGGVPLCLNEENQISLNMVPDNNGGAFVLWVDSRNYNKDLFCQHVTSNGTLATNWDPNGNPIANSANNEVSNSMWEDGQGGFIIAYNIDAPVPQGKNILMKRIMGDGTSAWGDAQDLCTEDGDQTNIKVRPFGSDTFIIAWSDKRNLDPDIYAQKVALDGSILWTSDLMIYGDATTQNFAQQFNPRVTATSDNAAIIVWEDLRNDPQYPDLYGQKIDLNGNLLWNADAVAISTAGYAQQDPRLTPDDQGGVFVAWDDTRDGNAPHFDVYAQHIDANGNTLLATDGLAICVAPGEQNGSIVKFSNGNAYINWLDARNGSHGLYYQVIDSNNQLVMETNGKQVFWGLSGDALKDQFVTVERENDMVAIWADTRYASFGYQIFYQIINANGILFDDLAERNGRSMTELTYGSQSKPAAVATPDGQVCVVWEEQRTAYPKVYAQLIDVDGARLWGDFGLELTVNTPLSQSKPKVDYYNGAFYFAWSNLDASTQINQVYAQKVVNGTVQWGDDGILISETATGQNERESQLEAMKGLYFVWTKSLPTWNVAVLTKRINEDGTTAAGFPDEGIRISEFTDTVYYSNQTTPIVDVVNDNLICFWKDFRNNYLSYYYGMMIGSDGSYLWSNDGVILGDNTANPDNSQEQLQFVVTTDENVVATWTENTVGVGDIFMQKLDFAGTPAWATTGVGAVVKDSTQTSVSIAQLGEQHFGMVWEDNSTFESDIFFNLFDMDGNPAFGEDGYMISEPIKRQYTPKIGFIHNQNAMTVWSDGRSSGKTEIIGLYAQVLHIDDVPNAEETIPGFNGLSVSQNYPNPFNPTTTIKFNLPSSMNVEVSVFNILGQKVRTLAKDRFDAGVNSLVWNGDDNSGKSVSSGIYFYKVEAGSSSVTKKMVLMK
jgi:hypothetical protein